MSECEVDSFCSLVINRHFDEFSRLTYFKDTAVSCFINYVNVCYFVNKPLDIHIFVSHNECKLLNMLQCNVVKYISCEKSEVCHVEKNKHQFIILSRCCYPV